MCLMAWPRSETAVTIIASLPPVSANKFRRGLSRSIVSAVSVPPVRITEFTFGWVMSLRPSLPPEHGTNCKIFFETPARQKHLQNSHTTKTVSDAGLSITVLAAASTDATPPQGFAIGKFHGETTTTTPLPLPMSVGIYCHQRAVSR